MCWFHTKSYTKQPAFYNKHGSCWISYKTRKDDSTLPGHTRPFPFIYKTFSELRLKWKLESYWVFRNYQSWKVIYAAKEKDHVNSKGLLSFCPCKAFLLFCIVSVFTNIDSYLHKQPDSDQVPAGINICSMREPGGRNWWGLTTL